MVIKSKNLVRLISLIFYCCIISVRLISDVPSQDAVAPVVAHADDGWVDPVDTTEDDLVLPSLQSGQQVDKAADPKFVAFLADIGGRLTLPQTYQSGLADLVISLRNDQMWKSDPMMRRSMLSLLHRAEVYARRNGGSDLQAVDQMVREAFELWPPGPDRPRIVGLMNSVAEFHDRQRTLAQAAQDKAARDAAKEAERLQREKDRADKQAADIAAAAARDAAAKAKPVKQPSPRVRKPRQSDSPVGVQNTSDQNDSSSDDGSAALMTRRPRVRKNKKQTSDGISSTDVNAADELASSPAAAPVDRLDSFLVSSDQGNGRGISASDQGVTVAP